MPQQDNIGDMTKIRLKPNTKWITSATAGKALGMSVMGFNKWCDRGDIPCHRLGSIKRIILIEDFKNYVEKQTPFKFNDLIHFIKADEKNNA